MPTGVQNGKYYQPEEVEGEWELYKRWCDNYMTEEASAGKVVKVKKPRIPTIEEFCYRLGIERQTLLNYETAVGYEAYFDIVKRIKREAKEAKYFALQNGIGNTTGLIFYLKAKEGWQDKQVIESTHTFKADFGTDTIQPTQEATGDTHSDKHAE